MNKYVYILLFTFVCAADFESAFALKENQRSNAIFQHRRLGMKNNFELAIHSLTFPLIPNIMLKKQHSFELPVIVFATRISFYSPSPLLKILQRKGIAGFLSDEDHVGAIPSTLIMRYELLSSVPLKKVQLSFKQGFTLGLNQNIDQRLSIDLPFITNRLLPMHDNITGINLGADIRFKLSDNIGLLADIDNYYYQNNYVLQNTYVEHKLLFQVKGTENIDFYLGYKSFYGPYYTNGPNKFRIVPVLDMSWNWEK